MALFPTVASVPAAAVHRFSELHPAIRLDIRSERQPQLIEWLENGTVDLSLLWDYQWQRLDSAQLDLTELFSDPTVLLVSAEHRLARRRRVAMAELAEESWVFRLDHPVVEVLQRAAVAAGSSRGSRFRPTTPGSPSNGGYRLRRRAGLRGPRFLNRPERPAISLGAASPPAGCSSGTAGPASTPHRGKPSPKSWSSRSKHTNRSELRLE